MLSSQIAFHSITRPYRFGTVAEAHCRIDNHHPPADGYTCGFYSLTDRSRIVRVDYRGHEYQPNSVALQVELFGDVVEGAAGFRAEYQSVTRIELARIRQSDSGCGEEAIGVRAERKAHSIDSDGKWVELPPPVCERHAHGQPTFSPADVAAAAGIDCVWAEDLDYPTETEEGFNCPTRRETWVITFAYIATALGLVLLLIVDPFDAFSETRSKNGVVVLLIFLAFVTFSKWADLGDHRRRCPACRQ